jgi:membrane associated rhomboid family serine protease
MPSLPPITQALLLINVGAFALDVLLGGLISRWFALWPIGTNFMPWQVVTYAFLHGGILHLLFNMLALWMFGGEMERLWGPKRYMQFYAVSLLSAALLQLVIAPMFGVRAPTVGASGAILGLLVGFAMTFPDRQILLLIPPVPIKAKWLVIIYAVITVYVLLPPVVPGVDFLSWLGGNAAHLAHLGGMIGGFLMIRYWRGQAPFPRRRR